MPFFENPLWKEYLSVQKSKLPELGAVEDVSPRVIRILAGNPGGMQLQGTNTYLVGTGKSRILVDSGQGFEAWRDRIVSLLQERGLEISHVLLTHFHGDHTGGLPDLVAYNPKYASRIYKCNPDPGQRPIFDNSVFRTQGATIRAVFTPGHAFDHMCFVLEEEGVMFTGDNVLGHGYTVVEDLHTYTESLHIMESQNCGTGYPGHGCAISDLPRQIKCYLRHRENRERQIYGTLASRASKGPMTVNDIIHAMYGEMEEEVAQGAIQPLVREVLWKLVAEGDVAVDLRDDGDERWRLTHRNE